MCNPIGVVDDKHFAPQRQAQGNFISSTGRGLRFTVHSAKPRLRGLSHAVAFVVALPLGLRDSPGGDRARTAFGDRVRGRGCGDVRGQRPLPLSELAGSSPAVASPRRPRRDLGLIAGTYTAFGLLALSGYWRWVVLSIVWAGRSRQSSSSSPGSTLRSGSPP